MGEAESKEVEGGGGDGWRVRIGDESGMGGGVWGGWLGGEVN